MPLRPSTYRRIALVTLLAALTCGVAYADFDEHPHLRVADQHTAAAIEQMEHAHNGDDWFGGHRVRAIRLLQQARAEMHRAAAFADHHHD